MSFLYSEQSLSRNSVEQNSSWIRDDRLAPHDLRRTCVSGMARLGIAPHVADKVLNHQAGTISAVAAVYQHHDFLAERRTALDLWGAHFGRLLTGKSQERRNALKIVA